MGSTNCNRTFPEGLESKYVYHRTDYLSLYPEKTDYVNKKFITSICPLVSQPEFVDLEMASKTMYFLKSGLTTVLINFMVHFQAKNNKAQLRDHRNGRLISVIGNIYQKSRRDNRKLRQHVHGASDMSLLTEKLT